MRTEFENYLDACINDGWCETTGDVNAPDGFNALVYAHEDYLSVIDFCETYSLDFAKVLDNLSLGHIYGVSEDSFGFIYWVDFGTMTNPANRELAERKFALAIAAYEEWAEEDYARSAREEWAEEYGDA